LNHEIGDDPVKHEAIVKSTTGKVQETGTGHLRVFGKHTELDVALACFHGNVDILNVAHVADREPRIRRIARIFLLNKCIVSGVSLV
jgi:hypothetical protein